MRARLSPLAGLLTWAHPKAGHLPRPVQRVVKRPAGRPDSVGHVADSHRVPDYPEY